MTASKGRAVIATTKKQSRSPARPKWSIRRFRLGSLVGPASVEVSFPTEGGGVSSIFVPQSDLRHRSKLLDKLADRLPVFPEDIANSDKARFEFVTELVSAYTGPFELVPDRTGFIDANIFSTPSEVIYADGRRQAIPAIANAGGRDITDLRGTPERAQRMLRLAQFSTYLAFALGTALAAALPNYIKLRRDQTGDEHVLLTETAVFNLSGPSGTGKSSAALAALSLAGSPDRGGTLDFSRRGLAEAANASNDLVLVLDDTEKAEDERALVRALKGIVHNVPGGRSKQISRGVDQSKFPQLYWSTFALSSSPRPIPELAVERGWTMTAGDQARLFNIPVPSSSKGGIFDLVKGGTGKKAERSISLIAKLERGYQNHHGHVIPRWVLYLMEQDRSSRVLELITEFKEQVGVENDGWEVRFANKFAYIYAAMAMGIEAGILPWKAELPLRAAKRCYRRARRAVMTTDDRFLEQIRRLSDLLEQKGRVVDCDLKARAPIVLKDRSVAIRYEKKGREKIGILDEALAEFVGSVSAKAAFAAALRAAGLILKGHGHAGTVQERIKTERNGKIRKSIRLWSVDAKKLARLVKNAGQSYKRA